jgi:hypothetical protein
MPRRHFDDRFEFDITTGRLGPGPEILAINLIAENRSFDCTWHEKFRRDRHRRQMAGSSQRGVQVGRRKPAIHCRTHALRAYGSKRCIAADGLANLIQ